MAVIKAEMSSYRGPAELVHPSTVVEQTMRNTWYLQKRFEQLAEIKYDEKQRSKKYDRVKQS